MTTQEAKEILLLYRPGTADAEDPAFSDALRLSESDPELKDWFDEHCQVYQILRGKFRQVAVPEGLKEQILAERKVHEPGFLHRGFKIAAAVAAAVVLVAAISVWTMRPREDTGFTGFENRMVSKALRSYGMDLATDDLAKIRQYLTQEKSPSDFTLPAGLKSVQPTGCVTLKWQNRPVSMICFKSGDPLWPDKSDIWLFVADNNAVSAEPTATPAIEKVSTATTAHWTSNGKIYLLVIAGNEAAIEKYL
ncbi:MAG TPA: hypothetical protein VFM25_12060 [Verrucomicrobiae bacterium]|nr:hypothetical protein [Verrucomicrobiae bacterium]